MHSFILVIVLKYISYGPAAVQVGPFYTAQSCLDSKAVVVKQSSVDTAFCVQVDR